MVTCKYCSYTECEWEEQEDDAGELRWVLLDALTGIRHRCKTRESIHVPKTFSCYRCKQPVVFGDKVGKSGRKVPLDPSTLEPHDCPKWKAEHRP
jgi:hypothetical protein